MKATFRPLRRETWQGKPTPSSHRRSRYQFRANWQATLDDLSYELEQLGAKDLVIEADFSEADIRLDGMPRANARVPQDPGVRIAFESKHGPLVYQCDTYDGWKENVRAIALGLKALRAVDRYGITDHAEQYTGFKAIGGSSPEPATFQGPEDAVAWLRATAGLNGSPLSYRAAARAAARKCHPDHGGTTEQWAKYDEATRLLKKEGLL